MILAHLKSRLAGTVLAGLPKEIQPEVARRLARFNRVSTDLLKDVEQVLNQSFFVIDKKNSKLFHMCLHRVRVEVCRPALQTAAALAKHETPPARRLLTNSCKVTSVFPEETLTREKDCDV